MSTVNYAAMSDAELKQYWLSHRDDTAAFHAYMDRRRSRPKQVLLSAQEAAQLPLEAQADRIANRLQSIQEGK
jgi:hypothetical protein